MDQDAAFEHARRVSREMVWLGASDRATMTQYLSAYRSYLQQGVQGTFTQLLLSRKVIGLALRGQLDEELPPPPRGDAAPMPTERFKRGSTTSILRSVVDLENAEDPSVSDPSQSAIDLAVGWLECDPLQPVPIVPGRVLSLGRGEECDVKLPHQGVSRIHAELRCDGGTIYLEDGSTFGTFVNGEKIHRETKRVEPGDVIAIGPYMLIVRDEDPSHEHADTLPFRIPGFAVEAMHGTLGDVSLSEVLQQIEFNEKTGTLRIISARGRGTVAFRQGRPHWATFGQLQDAEAIYSLLRLKEGEFSFVGEVEQGVRSMQITVTGLLMEFSRQVDEA